MESTFTIYASFPSGDVEELDVRAEDARAARIEAKRQLGHGYDPGARIIRIVRRLPGELYL